MASGTDSITRIKGVLRAHPKGIGITEIARKAGMHRSAAAKYLELLRISGHVEMRKAGMAKLYTLSQRVPLSAMLNFNDDIIIILDKNGRIIRVNDRYEALCGQSRERIIGTSLEKSDLPILEDPEICSLIRTIENPEILLRSYPMPGKQTNRHFRISLIPTLFDGGTTGTTVVGMDITREQEFSQKLIIAEMFYRNIIDKFPQPVCIFSPDLTITLTNKTFREYFKYQPVSDAKDNFLDITHGGNSDRGVQIIDSIRSNDLPFIYDQPVHLPINDNSNEVISSWIRWHFNPEYDTKGALIKIQATGADITREKDLEKEVEEKRYWIKFLSNKACQFSSLPPHADIYKIIAEGALQIIPDVIISHSSYDSITSTIKVRSIVGDQNKVIQSHFNRAIGLNIPVTDPDALLLARGGTLHQIPGGLHVATFGQIPPTICSKIEKEIHWRSTYGIGLTIRDQLLSVLVLLKCKEGPIVNPDILEAYVRLSVLALEKRLIGKFEIKFVDKTSRNETNAYKKKMNYRV